MAVSLCSQSILAVQSPNRLMFTGCCASCRNTIIVALLMPLSLIQPIANICWEFRRHEDVQNAK